MTAKKITWSDEETEFFLNFMAEKKTLSILDGKKFKTNDVFKLVEKEMRAAGFMKTAAQVNTKYKNLKCKYYECKRHNNVSGNDPMFCPYYELLNKLLSPRPASNTCSGSGPGFDSLPNTSAFDSEQINDEADEDNLSTISNPLMGQILDNVIVEIRDTRNEESETISTENDANETLTGSSVSGNSRSVPSTHAAVETPKSKFSGVNNKKITYSKALLQFGERNIEAQKNLQEEFLNRQEKLEAKMFNKFEKFQKDLLEQFLGGISSIVQQNSSKKKTHSSTNNYKRKKPDSSDSSNSDSS